MYIRKGRQNSNITILQNTGNEYTESNAHMPSNQHSCDAYSNEPVKHDNNVNNNMRLKYLNRSLVACFASSILAVGIGAPFAMASVAAANDDVFLSSYVYDSPAVNIVEQITGDEIAKQPDPYEVKNAETQAPIESIMSTIGISPDAEQSAETSDDAAQAQSNAVTDDSSVEMDSPTAIYDNSAQTTLKPSENADASSISGINDAPEDGKGSDTANNDTAAKHGIDVSEHNGIIDWEAVKNDEDIDFAIIRCGYGTDDSAQDDDMFERNISECERLGIPYGVYIYSYATTVDNAKSEAEHVLRLLGDYTPDLPVYYDMEDKEAAATGSENLADIAETFCNIIEQAGYTPGIYANTNWWNKYLTDDVFDQWEKWVAQYNTSCTYDGDYSIWQYTDKGEADGITSRGLDMNLMKNDIIADSNDDNKNTENTSVKFDKENSDDTEKQ